MRPASRDRGRPRGGPTGAALPLDPVRRLADVALDHPRPERRELGVLAQQLDGSDASVTAEVGLGGIGEGRFGLEVTLRVELPDELHGESGQRLVEATHQVCPYSNATRGNIPVELVIE
ncbi:hypothetical protein ACWENQ_38455 [Nonomuraea sp. NPDC004354]